MKQAVDVTTIFTIRENDPSSQCGDLAYHSKEAREYKSFQKRRSAKMSREV